MGLGKMERRNSGNWSGEYTDSRIGSRLVILRRQVIDCSAIRVGSTNGTYSDKNSPTLRCMFNLPKTRCSFLESTVCMKIQYRTVSLSSNKTPALKNEVNIRKRLFLCNLSTIIPKATCPRNI